MGAGYLCVLMRFTGQKIILDASFRKWQGVCRKGVNAMQHLDRPIIEAVSCLAFFAGVMAIAWVLAL